MQRDAQAFRQCSRQYCLCPDSLPRTAGMMFLYCVPHAGAHRVHAMGRPSTQALPSGRLPFSNTASQGRWGITLLYCVHPRRSTRLPHAGAHRVHAMGRPSIRASQSGTLRASMGRMGRSALSARRITISSAAHASAHQPSIMPAMPSN